MGKNLLTLYNCVKASRMVDHFVNASYRDRTTVFVFKLKIKHKLTPFLRQNSTTSAGRGQAYKRVIVELMAESFINGMFAQERIMAEQGR